MGTGLPRELLTLRLPGGVGIGTGDPLRAATELVAPRLLKNCLTELLTGSRIETANASATGQMAMIFFMMESLLAPTMKKNRDS
jgi:hypothetical protein